MQHLISSSNNTRALGPTNRDSQLIADCESKLNSIERNIASSIVGELKQVCRADLTRDDLTGFALSHYALGQRIGSGAMGQVYQAHHIHLGKAFAIKFIGNEAYRHPDASVRFLHEINAVGKLNHPNIVAAIDAGCIEGIHFLVTEWLDGHDLQQWIIQRNLPNVTAACEIIRQAAFGLAAAHAKGFTHRDIKPTNLFLERSGSVKILDFGLVRHNSDATQLTNPGQMIGTLDYLAPEQIDDATSANANSDIYSLGCTLIHLLSGCPPYPDWTHPTMVRKLAGHAIEQPRFLASPPKHIPNGLIRCLESMMAKTPSNRTLTAVHVADALAPYADHPSLIEWIGSLPSNEPVQTITETRGQARVRKWVCISLLGAVPLGLATWFANQWPLPSTQNKITTGPSIEERPNANDEVGIPTPSEESPSIETQSESNDLGVKPNQFNSSPKKLTIPNWKPNTNRRTFSGS